MQPILSLGASSVGAADMVRLRHAVGQASARLPFAVEWRMDALAETADVLFVDVDTIYGHVDWLRAQAGGRVLIALTSRPNGAHDNELARDAEPSVIESLLMEFASLAHAGGATSAAEDARSTELPQQAGSVEPMRQQAPASGSRLAETRELPALAREPSAPPAVAAGEPDLDIPPPPPREAMPLHDWLCAADGLTGVAALQLEDGARLVVDRAQSVYSGPSALKPLLALSQGMIHRSKWHPVEPGSFGEPMPLARLRLLAGLGAFEGQLGGELDPSLPFRLPRWPQIEREFPRHMRIATALMKGPATVDELVAQLGMPYAEVADFLNGFVAAGFVEQVPPVAEPEAPPPAAGERLMGRLRAFGRKP